MRLEGKDLGVDRRAERLDRVPDEGIPALLVAMQIADRQGQALGGARLGGPPSLNDLGIVQHCIDRARGLLRGAGAQFT
jgi:hypothetical protein